MIAAAFDTAERLFGLTFNEREDLPRYHPDMRAFEVRDRDGRHIGLFLGDYFARPSKRSGAWMSSFRGQRKLDGDVRPIIVNVMNFSKGSGDIPSLLSFDDARTLFHEFGHALHGLLSDVTYPAIAGTSVTRDFVEFPSQLYEHWLEQPEVLRRFALHYRTGEPMPEALLEKVRGPPLQQRVRHRRICLFRPRRSGFPPAAFGRQPRRWRIRARRSRRDPHARGDRDAAPHAAFHARLLRGRLLVRLLQLSLVRGAGCGRVRRVR